MADLTLAQCQALAANVNVNDTVTATWRYPNANAAQAPWVGLVKSKTEVVGAPGTFNLMVMYAGKGDVEFAFPPPLNEAVIISLVVSNAVARPAMGAVERLVTAGMVNLLDLSTWGPYLQDGTGIAVLSGMMRDRFRIPQVPQSSDMKMLRQTHYFEKLEEHYILQDWMIVALGRTDWNRPPLSSIAQRIITRWYAFEVAETEGGNLREFMAVAHATHAAVPKNLVECRKAALKKRDAKNEDE